MLLGVIAWIVIISLIAAVIGVFRGDPSTGVAASLTGAENMLHHIVLR